MVSAMANTTTTLRISEDLLSRADELVSWASTRPDLAPTGNATRATIMRAAILRGLESLERERKRTDGDDR